MTESARIIVVRHGETRFNVEGRWQGHDDSPLTEKGIAQAGALAKRLEAYQFSSVYSSDLGRAMQTARIITDQTGHDIIPDKRLRERNVGIFQGLTVAEIEAKYEIEWRMYRSKDPDYLIPHGESARQRFNYHIECFQELAEKNRGGCILIVGHGGVLNSLFRHVIGIQLEAPRRFSVINAGFNMVSCNNGEWKLETWGDIGHLHQDTALESRSMA
jgi:probable phosphoglycerate mutase